MSAKLLSIGLILMLCLGQFAGLACAEQEVVLTISGAWPDCRAIDVVGQAFSELYPNCTVVYEYLQNYYESLEKRMTDEPVDLLFCTSIQMDSSTLLPYVLDLNAQSGLDLSHTYEGLTTNFAFRDENGLTDRMYSIPVGAEMRGVYVNKTLLASLGLKVPTDQASLLAACETLKQNGYIPFQGNPGDFSQLLLYPWVCNLIANAEDPQAAYAQVNAHQPGISEMFREPLEFMYMLIEKGYYDYKQAQTELNLFVESDDNAYTRDFLDIRPQDDGYAKASDVGRVAFIPSALSLRGTLDKTKEDYHSQIEYDFIPAPVGPDGGFVYLSPAHGIAINAGSENLDWAVKFLDFMFQPENNRLFAENFNVIPNTTEAFDYIKAIYDVPEDRVSQLGQVTFDYSFYTIIRSSLISVSKANNPKYMADNDGVLSIYPFQHFMDELEASLTAQ